MTTAPVCGMRVDEQKTAAIRWLRSQGGRRESDPALEMLRQRHARGDISKEEFDAKKRDLA